MSHCLSNSLLALLSYIHYLCHFISFNRLSNLITLTRSYIAILLTQMRQMTFNFIFFTYKSLKFNLFHFQIFQLIHQSMPRSEYSPYLYNDQQQTNQKQTTSFKKYPANKYFDNLDQENDDIKSKLFIHQNPQDHFFMNQKVNQMIKTNSNHKQQYPKNCHNQNSRPIASKNVQTNLQRAKSCTTYKAKTKKSLNSKQKIISEQKEQQLLMYKQLCLSLRKQKQTLSSQLEKHQKRQNKFSSQIADLKQKIKKLYDHCIEKNKSSKNIDVNLIQLLNTHLGDKKSIKNGKQNNSFMINSKSELKNKLKTKTELKSNHQTVDTTTRTSRHELNVSSSFLKGQKRNCDKKSTKKTTMDSLGEKTYETERRKSKNYKFPHPSQFPKYDSSQLIDNQSSTVVSTTRPSSQKKQENIYKEFFSTFVKSLEIFEKESTIQHKAKNKLFKDGGYYVQWAKQEWFEIVQYLIKKGYVSGYSQNSKQKNAKLSINESRRYR